MSKRKGRARAPVTPDTAYTVRCYSVPEVATIIGVSERVLMSWARAGSIPYPIGHGTAALFTAEDLHTIQSGLALPGTYLISRHPMLKERIQALRDAARAGRASSPGTTRPTSPRRTNRMAKGGVS